MSFKACVTWRDTGDGMFFCVQTDKSYPDIQAAHRYNTRRSATAGLQLWPRTAVRH